MMVTRKGDDHHAYVILAVRRCGRCLSARLGVVAEETLRYNDRNTPGFCRCPVVHVGLSEFLRPFPFPVLLSITIGLLLPDLLVRRS